MGLTICVTLINYMLCLHWKITKTITITSENKSGIYLFLS